MIDRDRALIEIEQTRRSLVRLEFLAQTEMRWSHQECASFHRVAGTLERMENEIRAQ